MKLFISEWHQTLQTSYEYGKTLLSECCVENVHVNEKCGETPVGRQCNRTLSILYHR
jgi:hypothetical protein